MHDLVSSEGRLDLAWGMMHTSGGIKNGIQFGRQKGMLEDTHTLRLDSRHQICRPGTPQTKNMGKCRENTLPYNYNLFFSYFVTF